MPPTDPPSWSGAQRVSARLVLGAERTLEPGVVSIEGDSISSAGPLDAGVPDFEILAPGFVDLQVNGVGAIDVASALGGDWTALGRALLSSGVTTWCPTLVTAPPEVTSRACARVARAMAQASPELPQIAGVHLEGPLITVPGAHAEQLLATSVDGSWVSDLDPPVRIVTLAPELPGALTVVSDLSRKGILVALGHSACTAEEAHAAAAAGARLVTHLGNATGPFHQRKPGLLGAALCDDLLAVSLIADLEHVHPDVIRLAFAAKTPARVALVTDAVATIAGTVGPVKLDSGTIPGAAARLADGTLAGSSLTMERAVANVTDVAGIPLADSVAAASTTPAALLGLGDRGAIAAGLRADLVALSWDETVERGPAPGPGPGRRRQLRVDAVWLGGRLAWRPATV